MKNKDEIQSLIETLESRNKRVSSGVAQVDDYDQAVTLRQNREWIRCLKWVMEE